VSNVKSFEFKKAYEEVKINGNVYKVELGDEKVKEYQKAFIEFSDESVALQANKDITQEEAFDGAKELVKKFIDVLLGHDAFEVLYEQSGGSILNMIDLVSFLADVVKDKTQTIQSEQLNKYLKKPKGKK
jgi:hypothetical protein